MSSESPRVPADLTAQADGRAISRAPARSAGEESPGEDQPRTAAGAADHAPGTDFGPNQWLVDELYQRYQDDPGSVDQAWWNFFADYQPQQPDAAPAPASPAPPVA
ncbi:MAG: hypothetical protein ABSA03_15200, partial [Streptosporangiaceae bacterium]